MYTSQLPGDAEVIESVLREFNVCPIRFAEIGVFGGSTARGILSWCDMHYIGLAYWGVDNCAQIESQAPFIGAKFIKGDSAEVFHLVPFGLDAVLLDGCHCINHVILDVLHYGARVRKGGFLLLHDTSPEIQQTMRDPHGPDIPEFHNSVLAGLKMIGFPTEDWILWKESVTPGAKFGGMRAYKKL
jgi:hypothetical protein